MKDKVCLQYIQEILEHLIHKKSFLVLFIVERNDGMDIVMTAPQLLGHQKVNDSTVMSKKKIETICAK